jgi:hypothetical protein
LDAVPDATVAEPCAWAETMPRLDPARLEFLDET